MTPLRVNAIGKCSNEAWLNARNAVVSSVFSLRFELVRVVGAPFVEIADGALQ
jgi:hypothetical protein